MLSHHKVPVWVIGLALFSMFFGSGNLIFPLFIGELARDQLLYGIAGFVLTAVLLPFLGVVTMVAFRGNYHKFFDIVGKRSSIALIFLMLTVWIPLGSGPRCIALAHSSLATNLPMPPLWRFSIIYSGILASVVLRPTRIIDILGYFLTPALLTCLAIIIGAGFYAGLEQEPAALSGSEVFMTGLLEGYNTMDLIAAVFFSASIIHLIQRTEGGEKGSVRKALKACVIGVVLLAIVYVGLMALSSVHAEELKGVAKDRLLAATASIVLGQQWGIIASCAIALACFTTSVALTVVYAEFLEDEKWTRYPIAITLVICFLMSLTGLEGVTYVTAPILKVLYPVLIGLIVVNLVRGKHAEV